MHNSAYIVIATISFLGALAFAIAYFRGGMAKNTITLLQDNNKALGERVDQLTTLAATKSDEIAELRGQVEVLKTVPLQRIDKSISAMTKAVEALTLYMNQHTQQVDHATERIIDAVHRNTAEVASGNK